MATSLYDAAVTMMKERGWLCIPLRRDPVYPKIPMVHAWTMLEPTLETVKSMPWDKAEGLGIVLGKKSNLAVIDVDDEELANVIIATVWDHFDTSPRLVKTIRSRLHIYVCELGGVSGSSKFSVTWDNRPVTIELKSEGTQVAAPPTTGYTLLNPSRKPWSHFSVGSAWEFVVDCIKDQPYGNRLQVAADNHVPKQREAPWPNEVGEGNRNETAYKEAHRLRESSMPIEQALEHMEIRFNNHYVHKGMSLDEVRRTVESAYRKGEVIDPNDNARSDLQLFGLD